MVQQFTRKHQGKQDKPEGNKDGVLHGELDSIGGYATAVEGDTTPPVGIPEPKRGIPFGFSNVDTYSTSSHSHTQSC